MGHEPNHRGARRAADPGLPHRLVLGSHKASYRSSRIALDRGRVVAVHTALGAGQSPRVLPIGPRAHRRVTLARTSPPLRRPIATGSPAWRIIRTRRLMVFGGCGSAFEPRAAFVTREQGQIPWYRLYVVAFVALHLRDLRGGCLFCRPDRGRRRRRGILWSRGEAVPV